MERTVTTTILKREYPEMLFSYILQFIPDRAEAGELLVEVFSRLAPQLEQGGGSFSSVYCWLQVEARKIVLAHLRTKGEAQVEGPEKTYYFSLLTDASPEQLWIFRELFIYGRDKECVASRVGKDLAYVNKLLRECLLLIRKNLG